MHPRSKGLAPSACGAPAARLPTFPGDRRYRARGRQGARHGGRARGHAFGRTAQDSEPGPRSMAGVKGMWRNPLLAARPLVQDHDLSGVRCARAASAAIRSARISEAAPSTIDTPSKHCLADLEWAIMKTMDHVEFEACVVILRHSVRCRGYQFAARSDVSHER